MLSINTNLSSLIAQRSMSQSTNALDLAIERMSTGFKINHSRDNAANYSISNNMTTKMNAYRVAENNVVMGLDVLNMADEGISLISSKLNRLRALAEQAANATYGVKSLNSINAEANAIIDEMGRVIQNTEYNKMKLFKSQETQIEVDSDANTPKVNIKDITNFTEVSTDTIIQISDEEGLRKLATMVNGGQDSSDRTFKLTNDITLTQDFTPIGRYDSSNDIYRFYGDFDGCGYTIKGLNISTGSGWSGLFGLISESTIKNLNIQDANLRTTSNTHGIIVGSVTNGSLIENCKVTGTIIGSGTSKVIGGVAGYIAANSIIKNCIFTGSINATGDIGGITGTLKSSTMENCYSDVKITETNYNGGGLVGTAHNTFSIKNSYANCIVSRESKNGGIIGSVVKVAGEESGNIKNCYTNMSKFIGVNANSANVINSFNSTSDLTSASTFSSWTSELNDFGDPLWIIKDGEMPTLNTGYSIKSNSTLPEKNTQTNTNENDVTFSASLQVGINGNDHSRLELSFVFSIDDFDFFRNIGLDKEDYLSKIDKSINQISDVKTKIGAEQNRLESALDEIAIRYDNLASSRLTLRDADISKVSSEYIKHQILQQASATLLATANQTPSIALQLI